MFPKNYLFKIRFLLSDVRSNFKRLRQFLHAGPAKRMLPGSLCFKCNICGKKNLVRIDELGREIPSCSCGSTVRLRSIVHLLSSELFGESIALPDFPIRPDLCGWGMSDAGYATLLSKKMDYVNTFYHQEPRLDITDPLSPEHKGKLDFLISTEVFEHIKLPVSVAFENACQLLKPGGIFVFTTPFTLSSETQEHFPDLYQYEIVRQDDGEWVLRNTTRDGYEQTFKNLIFHGGEGSTLEMRIFSKNGLIEELEGAGFCDIKFHSEPCWEHGIYWSQPWSLPITARSSK